MFRLTGSAVIIAHPNPMRRLLSSQLAQWLGALLLVPMAWFLAQQPFGCSSVGSSDSGSWLGVDGRSWLMWSMALAVGHQVITSLLWRLQLGWQLLSKGCGQYDLAVFGAAFLPLLAARPLTVLAVGIADQGSLGWPETLHLAIGAALLVPAVWGSYSVARYFGLIRALGADHFRQRYIDMPFVRKGAFRVTDNAMYGLIFLGFWGIAISLNSRLALAAAFFQHSYIWVHWFFTEKPDIALIYADSTESSAESSTESNTTSA